MTSTRFRYWPKSGTNTLGREREKGPGAIRRVGLVILVVAAWLVRRRKPMLTGGLA